jgi:hypothetical protein
MLSDRHPYPEGRRDSNYEIRLRASFPLAL